MPKRASLSVAVVCAVLSAACGGSEPPPFKPVADLKQMMNEIIDPAADGVWEASGTITTAEGSYERGPKTEDEWTAARNRAMLLAESGNLLMLVPRAKDGGEWMKLSRALVEKGEASVRAIEARNSKQIFDVGGEVYEACLNCHQQYMPEIRDAMKNARPWQP
jgi:hypothetical protein